MSDTHSRTVEEHAEHIRQLVSEALAPGTESIDLEAALGRRTAAAVLSPVDLPLFRNSQMDGFAVRASTIQPGIALPIIGESAARPGEAPPLTPGSAMRIMTGAPLPDDADAVIPVENATIEGDTVRFAATPTAGTFVRERGSDLRAGDTLLPAGLVLGSRHLAALAAAGLREVDVARIPKVLVITTGSELVADGETPGPGQIYNSNEIALIAAIRSAGAEVAGVAAISDDLLELEAVLTQAAEIADVIVTSGGISEGDYEVVRQLIESQNGWVGHVAMQPGGPQATVTVLDVPLIAFPGNPVSTQISFEVFLAPLLRQATGTPASEHRTLPLTAGVRSIAGKRQFLRGRFDGDGVIQVAGASSHLVAALAAADVLIDIPAEVTELAAGERVDTWIL